MMFNTVPVALPLIRSGKLTALAVTARQRHFALPDVPTFAEKGYTSVESSTWVGLFAPAGTPREIVDKVAQALERALRDKSVVDLLRQQGAEPQFMGADAFARYVEIEIARWGNVVRATGIKLE
jgi:tripartite-type tricarboxylate transporter receptor subunit TctC